MLVVTLFFLFARADCVWQSIARTFDNWITCMIVVQATFGWLLESACHRNYTAIVPRFFCYYVGEYRRAAEYFKAVG